MLDLAVAAVAAALQGLGVGSSGTLVIYLTLIRGTDQVSAQGINLIFFIFSALAAIIFHAGNRKLYYGVLAVLCGFGILGAVIGALILNLIDPNIIRRIFGAMLVLSGLLSFFGKRKNISTDT